MKTKKNLNEIFDVVFKNLACAYITALPYIFMMAFMTIVTINNTTPAPPSAQLVAYRKAINIYLDRAWVAPNDDPQHVNLKTLQPEWMENHLHVAAYVKSISPNPKLKQKNREELDKLKQTSVATLSPVLNYSVVMN